MDSMEFSINQTKFTIYDNEFLLLKASANEAINLPPNAVLGLWPGPVGRQIYQRIRKYRTEPLTIYTLGRIEQIELTKYFGFPSFIRITEVPPEELDLAILTPRPTTLDINATKISSEQLMEEIGCIGTEEVFEHTEYCSDVFEKQTNKQLEDKSLEHLLLRSKRVICVFKSDLQASACAACAEAHIGFTGRILKQRGEVYADILSSGELTRIAKPWIYGIELNDRNIKCLLTQTAEEEGKIIAEVEAKDLQEYGKLIFDLEQAKIDVFEDYQRRIHTVEESLFSESFLSKRKVLFFSPHPDDDVVSAGAAMLNLCLDVNTELHVCWCVRGSVAVPDSFVQEIIDKFSIQIDKDYKRVERTSFDKDDYLTYDNLTAETATELFKSGVNPYTKGYLREVEAMSAVAEAGIFAPRENGNTNRVHFLRLPFYGTGFGKRTIPTEDDYEKVFDLIKEVEPDYMLLAGDLSDPHGTHGHCYDCIKHAVEEYEGGHQEYARIDDQIRYAVYNTRKVTDNVSEQKIFELARSKVYKLLYRGAWSEFNLQDVTLAIKMTESDLQKKLRCVRWHKSQMGKALYLGDDYRAFDVRAEERNRETARQLKELGLVEKDIAGAECFVGCVELP